MPAEKPAGFDALVEKPATVQDQQVEQLQKQLTAEKDGRHEDRFVGIVLLAILLDVVFFSVVSFGARWLLLFSNSSSSSRWRNAWECKNSGSSQAAFSIVLPAKSATMTSDK